MTVTRTTTPFATHYRAPWAQTPSGADLLTELVDAGVPATVPALPDTPTTRVIVQQDDDGSWQVEVVIPGDDAGSYEAAVTGVLEPGS